MDSAEAIVRVIETAFAGVAPGRITLHEAEAMDLYGSDVERREARRHDPEDDWRNVPGPSIEACPSALSYLDPEGWRFYLPAYLRLGLRHFGQPRNAAIDQAIYSLDAPAPERARTLNPAQARAVRQFLAFAAAHDDHCDAAVAGRALDAHWASVP
ncbi:MAG TPA: DUF6714 family protein [Polyangia bacterium]|jgi:hypothetical protein|nr:DUF6714 family protein [Polyangia bacterium]